MPYTNLHDLNIDWILKIVKDFQEKYGDFGETYERMLQEIEAKGQEAIDAINADEETAMQAINAFMQQCIQAIDTEAQNKVSDLQEVTYNQITAINGAGQNQRDLLAQDGSSYVAQMEALLSQVPNDYQDALNQLEIINSILNQNYQYPSIVQGAYGANSLPTEITQSTVTCSTIATSGCAGRTIEIEITSGTAIIWKIIYWTGWGSSAVWHSVNVQTTSTPVTHYSYTFDNDVTYFSIAFTYDAQLSANIAPSDFTANLIWHAGLVDDMNERIDNLSTAFLGNGLVCERITDPTADFNDYTTPGNYVVALSSLAELLTNCPSQDAGRLFVFTPVLTNRLYQFYFTIKGVIWIRRYTQAWAQWKELKYDYDFVNTPSNGNTNPITSGGVYTALLKYLALDYSDCSSITLNDDLNSYTTDGNYYAASNAIAQSLGHKASSNAGRLVVMHPHNGTNIMQFYIDSTDGSIFTRFYAGSWSAWNKIQNEITYDSVPTNGSTNPVTSDGIYDTLLEYFTLNFRKTTAIANGDDLNNYTTDGNYYSANSTISTSLSHQPTNNPGRLLVMHQYNSQRMLQFWFDGGDGSIWTRRFTSAWAVWERVLTTIKDQKMINIVYESGSFDSGNATERVLVYVPASTGYIMYRLYHYEIAGETNCNVWTIQKACKTTDQFSNATEMTISGEWECAIQLNSWTNLSGNKFCGGSTHGCEIMDDYIFLVNGIPYNSLSTFTTRTPVNDFKLIRKSKMYDITNTTRLIAEHGVCYHFNGKTLTIDQSLVWKVADSLGSNFLAMFLPSKNYIDRASGNSDFAILELATTTSQAQNKITKNGATMFEMWDTTSGLSAQVSIPVYPAGLTGGDNAFIHDNYGGNYNKLYFVVCTSGSCSEGELWKSRTIYKLDMN